VAKKKALVLSGGGGRGAYHIGVIEALVELGWMQDGVGPDIIAGTSIGAINAAAIASGMRVAELKERWLGMHTEDVHRLSRDLPSISRPLMGFMLRSVLTSEPDLDDEHDHDTENLPQTLPPDASTPQGFRDRLTAIFQMRPFRSLLDTAPWRRTLAGWMDFTRINAPEAPALLLAATDIQTGDLRVFCNRQLREQPPDQLTLDHLMASSSIPTVYPWTEIGGNKYWDGAVLANTPLGPVIDLAAGEDVDILVVMMTPWDADPAEMRAQLQGMPHDLVQGLSLTLDWALLASYRTAIKMLRAYNKIAAAAEMLESAATALNNAEYRLPGRVPHKISEPTVIAPRELMPLEWIIDYEEENHRRLFELGYQDARNALDQRLLSGMLGDP
jgi:NTE family protein